MKKNKKIVIIIMMITIKRENVKTFVEKKLNE